MSDEFKWLTGKSDVYVLCPGCGYKVKVGSEDREKNKVRCRSCTGEFHLSEWRRA